MNSGMEWPWVVVNLFMEAFEHSALECAPLKPSHFKRYVDDIFINWSHGHYRLDEFLTFLNSLHPNIKFTMEIKTHRKLPVLDV